jgi:hypothetical protein
VMGAAVWSNHFREIPGPLLKGWDFGMTRKGVQTVLLRVVLGDVRGEENAVE